MDKNVKYIKGNKEILEKYQQKNLLGQSLNYVYEVEDIKTQEKFALKVINLENSQID